MDESVLMNNMCYWSDYTFRGKQETVKKKVKKHWKRYLRLNVVFTERTKQIVSLLEYIYEIMINID